MIRKAELKDLLRMGEAAQEFYASSKFLNGFQLERFAATWVPLLKNETGVIFVLEDDRGIQGAIGGVAYPEPYSGVMTAVEMFWFVRPGHRGAGIVLYRQFEDWARERECQQIRMVHLNDSMPEKLGRLYRRWGYEPAEMLYVKRLGGEARVGN